jgi:intracellular sulfur oxidation DsrE/DsrF family protein
VQIKKYFFRLAKQLAAVCLESSSLCSPPSALQYLGPTTEKEWTPSQWLSQSSSEEEDQTKDPETPSLVPVYNEAMAALSKDIKTEQVTSLDFQLKKTWCEVTEREKKVCIDKVVEGCKVVCSVIAPNTEKELLQACSHSINADSPSSELQALMQAYKNAKF